MNKPKKKKNELLVDSSLLYALYDPDDKHHRESKAFVRDNRHPFIVLDVALTEVAHLLLRSVNQRAVLAFLNAVTQPPIQLQPVLAEDVKRAREIMHEICPREIGFCGLLHYRFGGTIRNHASLYL